MAISSSGSGSVDDKSRSQVIAEGEASSKVHVRASWAPRAVYESIGPPPTCGGESNPPSSPWKTAAERRGVLYSAKRVDCSCR